MVPSSNDTGDRHARFSSIVCGGRQYFIAANNVLMEAFLLPCGESFNFKKENIFFSIFVVSVEELQGLGLFVLWVYLVGK